MIVETLKSHWKVIGGSFVGLLVLYFLFKSLKGGSSNSAAPSASTPNSSQVQALTTAADLQNAQINGQVAMTQYQASAIDNQTAAALQLGEVQTAAQLAAAQSGQAVDLAKTKDTNATAVALAHVTADAQVTQTAITAQTIDDVTSKQINAVASVQNHQLDIVANQVGTLMKYSKHFNTDITKLTPTLAVELGNTPASVAASGTVSSVENSSAQKTGAIAGAVSGVVKTGLAGLLG